MGNVVTNILEIKGTKNQIQEIFDRYSTSKPKVPHFSYNGDETYRKENAFGWLNVKTNVFSRRNENDVIGIPEGYVRFYESEYTIFPDFNKIISIPEPLNLEYDSWMMILDNEFTVDDGFKYHLDVFKKYLNKTEDSETKKDNFITGIKNYLDYGYTTWYGWCKENWGTRYNAYDCVTLSRTKFKFKITNNNVVKIIKKISLEYPYVKLIYTYINEDTGYKVGRYTYFNGEETSYIPENGSKAAYDMCFEIDPDKQNDYKLVDGKYINKEE